MIRENFDQGYYQGYTERRNAIDPHFYNRRREILIACFEKVLNEVFTRNLSEGWKARKYSILDVGCGEKIIGKAIESILPSANVISMDIDFRVLQQYGEGNTLNARAQFLPFADASVDILVSTELIEHLDGKSGEIFLQQAAKILRKGGLLYIETPNDQSIKAKVMREQWPMNLPEHLTFYSPRKIRSCLRQSGFSKVKTGTRYEEDDQVNEPWRIISSLNVPLNSLLPWRLKLFLARIAITLLDKGAKTTAIAIK